ncbi:MAG: phosphatase PAP2 family protein [Acidobacteriota bacterium]|nr:phosphatase PAP2 family protein [Acidobacteriota bacterium]
MLGGTWSSTALDHRIPLQPAWALVYGPLYLFLILPYNCFPSLHVAHSFVSALSGYRVHRGLGVAALAGALLVGVSTLFTKQHYVLDVAAGVLLASLACALFLRRLLAGAIPDLDRRIAPALALVVTAIVVVMAAACGMLYMLGVEVR